MDASEFKEFIFGLLFLKRLSDEFDRKREQVRADYAHLKDQPDLLAKLKDEIGRQATTRVKTHPGRVLRTELEARGMSANRLALAISLRLP